MCFIFLKNPIIELCLWHVKYLGHGAAGNVMTGIGIIRSSYMGFGRGLLEIYWGCTDAASAGDVKEVD